MLPRRKFMRSNNAQLETLVNYMVHHKSFANGEYVGPLGTLKFREEWESLRALLRDHGPDKSVEQWRYTWRDLKARAKEELRRCKMRCDFKGNPTKLPMLTERSTQILTVIGMEAEFGIGEPVVTGVRLEHSKTKKKNVVFATVKQACVDLVKKHGHPITLIDEEPFRNLIQLMPMTMKEKARITSEYIQKCVDATGEEDEEEMSYQDDQYASEEDEGNVVQTITVKGEIEDVPCHCDARVTERGAKSHQIGCPAAAKQPYWNYFEVTTDEATCQICQLTLNWTNITKLKDHILDKHPTAEFLDDGAEFSRGPTSDVWSHEETEEVYLEDFDEDDDPLPPPSSRKRKRTSERLKSRDERPEKEKEKSREEMMREMKLESEKISAARMKAMELEPDRFKSLDVFGMYVAELMKLIPKDKCMKYQVQIVQRLLQEQAAAG